MLIYLLANKTHTQLPVVLLASHLDLSILYLSILYIRIVPLILTDYDPSRFDLVLVFYTCEVGITHQLAERLVIALFMP